MLWFAPVGTNDMTTSDRVRMCLYNPEKEGIEMVDQGVAYAEHTVCKPLDV